MGHLFGSPRAGLLRFVTANLSGKSADNGKPRRGGPRVGTPESDGRRGGGCALVGETTGSRETSPPTGNTPRGGGSTRKS